MKEYLSEVEDKKSFQPNKNYYNTERDLDKVDKTYTPMIIMKKGRDQDKKRKAWITTLMNMVSYAKEIANNLKP